MSDKMTILQPNVMGGELDNIGLDSMVGNYGFGVSEMRRANQQADQDKNSYVNEAMEKLRRHKAREFGLTKETVGF